MKLQPLPFLGAALTAAVLLVISSASQAQCGASHGSSHKPAAVSAQAQAPAPAEQAKYSCPMHPEVASARPGKCSKCGMYMEAKPQERTIFVCPMHPEVRAEKAGKCEKCGMALEKRTEKIAPVYACPMHPEVRSDKPGVCSKCGMHLSASEGAKARSEEAPKAPASDPHAGHDH